MYVKPEFRTKGIGRALSEQIIREAKKMGYRRMCLCTGNTWVAAQKLYQSLGFTPTNQYYDFPPNLLPSAVFMELSLE
jgi:ribosomal protein S18 acetylase RimI-like enzyme